MMTSTELYWDPYDYDLHADPHPVWRRMREEAPLYRNDRFDFWALSRFQDVWDTLGDWRSYSSAQGPILEMIRSGPVPDHMQSIIMKDPPRHTALRQTLNRAFTPRRVADLEAQIRAFVQKLLDEFTTSSGFDYVADFGAKIPGMVIATMLGTPDAALEEIRRLTDESLHLDEGDATQDAHYELAAALRDIHRTQLEARKVTPGDDLMSALLAAEITDDDGTTRRLTDTEMLSFIGLLSAAGNETVAKFVGWAGATLARYPAERAKLVADPDLIPNGVEEILRFEPPAMALARVTKRDVTLYDEVVPEGSAVVLVTAATGRDQRVFDDPDRLDVARPVERHLSFGFGPHVCLGAWLARLQARIVVEETLLRFPEWDVEWDQCEIVHTGSSVRGYAKLPIRVA
jgi:cytochrome P450